MKYSDKDLIQGIQIGDMASYEALYKEYYVYLCYLAEHIVKNRSDAEEIVSDVFVKLWNIQDKLNINGSIKAYLITAVRNTSINYLERPGHKMGNSESISIEDLKYLSWNSDYPLGQLFEKEMTAILERGIRDLPEACRNVFLMSRDEDLTYNDIAEKLGISVNTVKAHMKNALARLRIILKDYIKILLAMLGI